MIAFLNAMEVLGVLGIVAAMVGLVMVAKRLSDEVNDVGQDMVDLFTQGR